MQTPATHMRHPPQSQYSRGPPAPSQANTMRSRMAGALRGDGDMESQDLFDIQEQQEARSQAAQSMYPPTHGPQSQASRSQPPMSEMSTRVSHLSLQNYAGLIRVDRTVPAATTTPSWLCSNHAALASAA